MRNSPLNRSYLHRIEERVRPNGDRIVIVPKDDFEALDEAVTAAFTFEEAFFRTALAAKACCFCGPLKRGYVHDDKCAFVDFVNAPAVTHLKGNSARSGSEEAPATK